VDKHTISPAGDPFTAKTAPQHERLAKLEERYRHELLVDDEVRQELRDRILRIRRRLKFGLSKRS
jgi:hypothetical protein